MVGSTPEDRVIDMDIDVDREISILEIWMYKYINT